MDTSRLTKLLALTASESDGEALNAIRAANAFLKKHSLTWSQLTISIGGGYSPPPPRQRSSADPFAGAFEDEFIEILRQARRSADERARRAAAMEAARRQAQQQNTRSQESQLYDMMLRACIEHFAQAGALQTVAILTEIRTFYHKNGYLTQIAKDTLMQFWNTVKNKENIP